MKAKQMSEAATQEASAAPVKAKRTPPEVFKIAMLDGRTVEFTGTRKKLDKEVVIDEAAGTVAVRFDFRNGESRTFVVPQALILQAAGHGVSQKVGDETAGEDKVEDMVLAVDDMLDRLTRGEWTKARGEGDGFSGASIVIRALCNVTGKTPTDIKAFLQGKLDSAKAAGKTLSRADLYKSFKVPGSTVGMEIKRLEDEQITKEAKLNGDDLLAELQAVGG